MAHSGREFELLVRRIETTLAGEGVVVTSPDRLLDLDSGEWREVDASIRARLGSTEIVITLECRDRKAPADARWIEELASKRDSLGVARTIAITSSRFTAPALTKARRLGIETRTISSISAEDISG